MSPDEDRSETRLPMTVKVQLCEIPRRGCQGSPRKWKVESRPLWCCLQSSPKHVHILLIQLHFELSLLLLGTAEKTCCQSCLTKKDKLLQQQPLQRWTCFQLLSFQICRLERYLCLFFFNGKAAFLSASVPTRSMS